MFDEWNFLASQDSHAQSDRTSEQVTLYGAYFSIGILITLIVRTFPLLQWLYWITCTCGLVALGVALVRSRQLKLIAIAAIVIASMIAGNLDGLLHGASQVLDRVEEGLPR